MVGCRRMMKVFLDLPAARRPWACLARRLPRGADPGSADAVDAPRAAAWPLATTLATAGRRRVALDGRSARGAGHRLLGASVEQAARCARAAGEKKKKKAKNTPRRRARRRARAWGARASRSAVDDGRVGRAHAARLERARAQAIVDRDSGAASLAAALARAARVRAGVDGRRSRDGRARASSTSSELAAQITTCDITREDGGAIGWVPTGDARARAAGGGRRRRRARRERRRAAARRARGRRMATPPGPATMPCARAARAGGTSSGART